MRVRAIQFSPVLGDISKNLIFHKKKIEEAKKDKIEDVDFNKFTNAIRDIQIYWTLSELPQD